MSQPVTDPVAAPLAELVADVLPADVPEAVIGEVIAELLPAEGPQVLGDDPVEAAAAITELVEAATRQVFAPDPLADPVAALTCPAPAPEPADPAAAAAARAGVDIRPVDTHLDVAAAVSVLDGVFAPGAAHHFYPPSLLRNLLAAGSPVLLAWDGETPVGVLLALPGWTAHGQPLVQSGPMAVLPAARGRGVSIALKLAQRAWAHERGVTEIRWTFDVMAAVNANLNLRRLGATVEAFLPGYEGLRDADSPTPLPYDRLLVAWHLTGAPAAPTGCVAEPVWAVAAAADGLPVLDSAWVVAPAALVAVPADICALRRDAPALASAWQHAVGGVLREALAAGWRVGWDPRNAYLLTAPTR
ncbi:GNAT family N-acetyltransferase [Micromonospora eburnea]|uniref:Predicted acetyltransferase, GNAT superfamily n=1 Tax=Micromonospora eburnea TaxID=227316 RepID=A0A1C6UTN0_9ACTN|nr:GNAT family N-acetyltransferase [Micromonospora eburnea]SCL57179.1 Predicted acetyltransferase, GNAT superfamily [Micromonospora eburnea]